MQYEDLILKLNARPKISAAVQEILSANPIKTKEEQQKSRKTKTTYETEQSA